MWHRAHGIHESAVYAISNSVLLRNVRHCEQVVNDMFRKICSKRIGQELTAVIDAQNVKLIAIRGVL